MNSRLRITLGLTVACALIIFVLVIYFLNHNNQLNCYRAAVLDHHIKFDPNDINNVEKNINLNFKVYNDSTVLAKKHDVDLIVLPENGLMAYIKNRQQALNYSINVPSKKIFLCNNINNIFNSSVSIIERLSCLAKTNKIFLVAQLLDKQLCQDYDPNSKCPSDGHFIFNTAVMFDRQGQLIAKYHKMQLFGEMSLNAATQDELIYVDTEIGRFGFQICFDIIYQKPGHWLASKYNVDTIIFPTYWFNEAPFLSAAQFQMAWAFGNNVNLLASNIHSPKYGTVGSGIYWGGPERYFISANFVNDTGERLVITELPIKPHMGCKCKPNGTIIQIDQGKKIQYGYLQMNNTNVSMIALDQIEGINLQLRHNGVICHLSYKADFSHLDLIEGQYFLLASNRSRPNPSYNWWEEFCAITYCLVDSQLRCSKYSTNNLQIFKWIKITATFSNKTVIYPSAVEYQHQPIPMRNIWRFMEEKQKNDNDSSNKNYTIEFGNETESTLRSLTTLALYGRNYERDPPYKQVPVKQKI